MSIFLYRVENAEGGKEISFFYFNISQLLNFFCVGTVSAMTKEQTNQLKVLPGGEDKKVKG